jgi:hypothetical protein
MRVQTYCSTLFHFLSNGKNNIQVETTYTVSTRLDNFAHISYTDKLACLSWMQDPTAGMFYRDQKQVFCLHRTRKTTYMNKETTLLVYLKEHNKEQSKCIWVLLARGKIQTTRKPPTMQEKIGQQPQHWSTIVQKDQLIHITKIHCLWRNEPATLILSTTT